MRSRTDCCATWPKPCSYHEGWADAEDYYQLSERGLTSAEAETELARVLAKRRVGSAVYMNGIHNPLPTEVQAARDFLDSLVRQGWRGPA